VRRLRGQLSECMFGNILAGESLAEIMNSPVRRAVPGSAMKLMEQEDCAECEFLPLCHGGCPVHAYATTGNLFTKDPYCESRKTMFRQNAAIELMRSTARAEGPLATRAYTATSRFMQRTRNLSVTRENRGPSRGETTASYLRSKDTTTPSQ
jgi:radical SAM protein with 4Fe4S-binding SPASM domain